MRRSSRWSATRKRSWWWAHVRGDLEQFFDALDPERSAQITRVSADAAEWISTVVADRCTNAIRCADPFHFVASATEALDEERRWVAIHA